MIRNACKGFLLSLAAAISFQGIGALAVAGRGFAQDNGSPDGLYTGPDSGENVRTGPDSTSSGSAQSYMNSLDAKGEQFKSNLAKADEARRYGTAANPPQSLAARTWIAILAGAGLVVSLCAGGYVWWSRSERSKAGSKAILALAREPALESDSADKPDEPPQRRAA